VHCRNHYLQFISQVSKQTRECQINNFSTSSSSSYSFFNSNKQNPAAWVGRNINTININSIQNYTYPSANVINISAMKQSSSYATSHSSLTIFCGLIICYNRSVTMIIARTILHVNWLSITSFTYLDTSDVTAMPTFGLRHLKPLSNSFGSPVPAKMPAICHQCFSTGLLAGLVQSVQNWGPD
jgi:hypothetical protein